MAKPLSSLGSQYYERLKSIETTGHDRFNQIRHRYEIQFHSFQFLFPYGMIMLQQKTTQNVWKYSKQEHLIKSGLVEVLPNLEWKYSARVCTYGDAKKS